MNHVVPAGVSPHGFDLSPKDLVSITESELIVTVGIDHIDGFMDVTLADKKHLSFATIDGIDYEQEEEHEDEHHDEHEEKHEDDHHDDHKDDHTEDQHHDEHKDEHHEEEHDEHEEAGDHHDHHDHGADPHLWLSQNNINLLAQTLADTLSESMPEQAEYFENNAIQFSSDLQAVYDSFATDTSQKTGNEFIVFHDAYDYMFDSAGINTQWKQIFSENIFGEIGTAHTQKLIDAIAEHDIKHAYREPQLSDEALQNFASRYNLSVGLLDPIGQDPSANGYIQHIQGNLQQLSKIYE